MSTPRALNVERVSRSILESSPDVCSAWGEMTRRSRNPYVLYQSLPWWRHMAARSRNPHVVVARTAEGEVAGLAPVIETPYRLQVGVGGRRLVQFNLCCAQILGGRPLVGNGWDAVAVQGALFGAIPQGAIYLKSVPEEGPDLQVLRQAARTLKRSVYLPEDQRAFHYLELPESLEAYLQDFPRKKRYNLRRQDKQLTEACGEDLNLVRIERPDQTEGFVQSLREVVSRSWKDSVEAVPEITANPPAAVEFFSQLADQGILRSYVLRSQDRPLTFVIGYVYGGVFHYSDIGYDRSFERFSPGTTLLLRMIEDLINRGDTFLVNFGIGDSPYKQTFGNRSYTDCDVLILTPTVRNHVRRGIHAAARSGKEWIRRFTSRGT